MDKEALAGLYRRMVLIRGFEYRAKALKEEGLLRGSLHMYVGQEAVAVGACSALRKGDYITSTHRGHGHALAMGADPGRMLAELLGRVDGYCRGRGGSMHTGSLELGIIGSNGIVGAGIPIAAGGALALARQGKGGVVLCFFGDGAMNTGAFHEGINLAAVWKLPVVFLVENNLYGLSTGISEAMAVDRPVERAAAYGLPGVEADGNDVLAVREAVLEAVERARKGLGPTLLVANTYRTEGHFAGDPEVYRDPGEAQEWLGRDPISLLRQHLEEMGFETGRILEIEEEVRAELDRAEDFARRSPEPSPDELYAGLYAGGETP